MTTIAKSRSLKIRSIRDFKRLGIIGRRFGDLKVLAVRRAKSHDIGDTICIVTCSKGHQSERPWRQLRNRPYRPTCMTCHPEAAPQKAPITNLGNKALIEAIGKLPPQRRRLMNLILADRRQIGEEYGDARTLLSDAYVYASSVVDVEGELEERAPTCLRETYNGSTLTSPSLIYMAVE